MNPKWRFHARTGIGCGIGCFNRTANSYWQEEIQASCQSANKHHRADGEDSPLETGLAEGFGGGDGSALALFSEVGSGANS
jgi:hypothetical protein